MLLPTSRAPSPKTKIAGSDGGAAGGAADAGGSAGCGAGDEGCSGCATAAAVLLERTWKDIVIIKREEPMLHLATVRCRMQLYTSDRQLMDMIAKRMELAGTYYYKVSSIYFISGPDISWSYSTTCSFHCFDAWHGTCIHAYFLRFKI